MLAWDIGAPPRAGVGARGSAGMEGEGGFFSRTGVICVFCVPRPDIGEGGSEVCRDEEDEGGSEELGVRLDEEEDEDGGMC